MLVRTLQPPSPRCLRVEVHPSVSFTSPAECCVLRPASGPAPPDLAADQRAPKAPSLRFFALIATSAGSVHTRAGCPPRASVRPRRFARPRRFTPPPALRVCFAPQPRTGFTLQGFVPRLEHEPVSRPALPSCRCAPRSAGCPVPATPSTSGPCSPGGCGGCRRPLSLLRLRAPLGLAPPPGLPPAHRAADPGFSAGPATSACDLHRDEPTAADPWRLAGARVGWSGIRLPARSRSSA